MANKIKWNLKAFTEVRNSPEVKQALQDKIDDILEEVNHASFVTGGEDLYKGEVSEGKSRAAGRVWTAGAHAERENAKNNTLVRALANLEGDA